MQENEVITVHEIYDSESGYLYMSCRNLEDAIRNSENRRDYRIEKNTYIYHEDEPWELLDSVIEEEG